MADAATLSDIIEKVHTISSYADLKRIRLQLLRRERELNINRAAQFKPEAEVCMNSGGRRSVFRNCAAGRRRERYGEDGPRVRRADTRNKAAPYIHAAHDCSRMAPNLRVGRQISGPARRVK